MKNGLFKTKKLRLRRCLICSGEFSSFSNRICPQCHKRHAVLFENCGFGPNDENLIYCVDLPDDSEIAQDSKSPDSAGPGEGGSELG